MRKVLLIVSLASLALFILCLGGEGSLIAESEHEKIPIKKKEVLNNASGLPLHQYYQKHLTPYLNGLRSKTNGPALKYVQEKEASATISTGSLLGGNAETASQRTALSREEHNNINAENNTEEKTFISLHKSEAVGRAVINKNFPKEFKSEYDTELLVGYKITPLVDILFGKVQKLERSQDRPWEMHDDGWTLKLQKNF